MPLSEVNCSSSLQHPASVPRGCTLPSVYSNPWQVAGISTKTSANPLSKAFRKEKLDGFRKPFSQPESSSCRLACPGWGNTPESPKTGICLRQKFSVGFLTWLSYSAAFVASVLILQPPHCAWIKGDPCESSTWDLSQARH